MNVLTLIGHWWFQNGSDYQVDSGDRVISSLPQGFGQLIHVFQQVTNQKFTGVLDWRLDDLLDGLERREISYYCEILQSAVVIFYIFCLSVFSSSICHFLHLVCILLPSKPYN